MDSHAQTTSNPPKTSAFIPVIKSQVASAAIPAIPIRQPEREEGIFESSDAVPLDRSMQSEEHPSEDYYCMTCHENFNIKISPCNHKKGKVSKYICDYDDCKRVFNIGSGLQRHKLVHTGARPYECDFEQCDQKFNQKSNLNRHRRIHTQQKPFICEKCCKSFTTTTNLKQHVQVHLEDKQKRKKYVCQIKGCNKQYLYMCNLKKHKQQHQDPLCECIGQKKPDFPAFSLIIGHCSFKILYKRAKDHSELLITYRELESAINYRLDHFSKVLQLINSSEEKAQMSSCMEEMEAALEKIFENAKNALNICFEMHSELSPVANLLVKGAMGLIGTMGAKVFTMIVPSYAIFRDIVQNLLNDFQSE